MRAAEFRLRHWFGFFTAFFIAGMHQSFAENNELRSTSAIRAEILKIVQDRTNRELNSESQITVRSWTNTDDHVLVVAKPQVSMFRDRIVFALLMKAKSTKKKSTPWKIIEYQVSGVNQNPLRSWEKKHKILPKDLFMLAQIAIQVED